MLLTFASIRNERYFISIACLEQENSNREGKNFLCALPLYTLTYTTTCMSHSACFWTLLHQKAASQGTNRSRELFIYSASTS